MPASPRPLVQPISARRWVLGYLMQEKAIFIPSLLALFL